jgi:hypothetical protein
MAGKINFLSDTFPCATTAAIVARRVVVADGTTRGNVKLPAATPEKTAVGVTVENQTADGQVAVQIAGVAIVESDGSAVINPGDNVIAVGTTGRIKSQAIAAGSANVYDIVGRCISKAQAPATAGALVDVELTIGNVVVAA